MLRSFSASVLLLVWVADFASVSVAKSSERCAAEEGLRADHREGEAALLQLASKTSAHTKQSVADEQLSRYTQLKEELAQSHESAQIMMKIDEALDGSHEGIVSETRHSVPAPNDVRSLDDVIKAQDVPHAQVHAVAAVRAKHHAIPEISLVESGATRSVPHRRALKDNGAARGAEDDGESDADNEDGVSDVDAASGGEESDDSISDEQNEDLGGASMSVSKSAATENDDAVSDTEAASGAEENDDTAAEVDDAASDAGNADSGSRKSLSSHRIAAVNDDTVSDGDTSAGSEDDEDTAGDASNDGSDRDSDAASGNDESDEDQEADADSAEEDDFVEERRARKLSLIALKDELEADRAPLNENGYLDVASSRSNRRMERFVERLASEMSLLIVDVGGLKGMVPFYSGQKATQSLEALQAELLSTARMNDGWLVKEKRPRRENLLLQTDATQHHATVASKKPLSLLSAVRVVHKVPDLAVAVFGSRTLVLMFVAGLVVCIFCIDERKRTSKGVEYEDPLNMSPTPPPVKEDPVVTEALKLLRGQKNP